MEGFPYAYEDALKMVPLDQEFRINFEMLDILMSACVYAPTDDVKVIQTILDRGFDKRNIRLTYRVVINLLHTWKTKIIERLFMITETHTKYPQIFNTTFVTAARNYTKMFSLLIYMFECGARPVWLRCTEWNLFIEISGIYNHYENVRKVSIALIATKKAPRDILRIISRVLWSTRADERWYKLK